MNKSIIAILVVVLIGSLAGIARITINYSKEIEKMPAYEKEMALPDELWQELEKTEIYETQPIFEEPEESIMLEDQEEVIEEELLEEPLEEENL